MSIAKNMLLSSNSSNEKTNQKDSDDLWRRKLTLKVKFRHFLTHPHYTNLQNSMVSFDYSWFLAKNLSNFVPSLENSTIGIGITGIVPAPWHYCITEVRKASSLNSIWQFASPRCTSFQKHHFIEGHLIKY